MTMSLLLGNAAHYLRYMVGVDQAHTQTTEAERSLLGRLAGGRKVIVELGVFEGVSSLILRTAMDKDAELYCIDPFPKGRLLFSPQRSISRKEIAKCRNGAVHLLRCYSYEAIKNWTKPVDLLYMDADHSFEGALRDFRQWTQFIQSGGLILIHTSRCSANKIVPDTCGPLRLVNEIIARDSGFKIDSYVDSITVVEKR